jgi:hypothetical protein
MIMTTHSRPSDMEDGEGWKVGDGFGKKAELYLWQCIVVLD